MKTIFGFCALIFVGMAGWKVGGQLSSDAIGMALGLCFGVMAAVPAMLLAFAQRRYYDEAMQEPQYQQVPTPTVVGQPAIIVNNYSLTVAPIDPRLDFTGEVTMDGYYLARCAVGIKQSQIADSHDGYSVTRFGPRIGLKPLNDEAARQIKAKTYEVIS